MIAVLFSWEQKCFHIETMQEYIESNILATKMKQNHQYRLVAIAKDWQDADKICDILQSKEPFKSLRLNK